MLKAIKLKRLIKLFFCCIFFISTRSQAQYSVSIHGFVSNPKVKIAEVCLYDTLLGDKIEVPIQNGEFSFYKTVPGPMFASVKFPELQAHVDFLADTGRNEIEIAIDSTIRSGRKYYVGHLSKDLNNRLTNVEEYFRSRLEVLRGTKMEVNDRADLEYKIFDSLLNARFDNIFLSRMLPQFDNFTYMQALTLFNKLSLRLQAIANAYAAQNYLLRLQRTSLGAIFRFHDEFDTSGAAVNLRSLNFRFMLVDFGSSSCQPCRQEFPRMKEIFSKYNSRGFEIVGDYLEFSRSAWVKSLIQDNIPWKVCSTIEGYKSMSARYYGITYIPFNLIINNKLEIVAKNLSVDEINSFLEKELH